MQLEQEAAHRIDLRAGPLTMVFEPENAFLRYVRLGATEVLRGIYAAVRDHHWDTVLPEVSNLSVDRSPRHFSLAFDARARRREVDFFWRGRVEGSPDGTVRFEMDGEALSTFSRNRIGFCVLHPIRECAGRPCTVTSDDGGALEGRFPEDVSPYQPFENVRALAHEVRPGVRAEVAFEGDVFETEDQRNWSDASYKTYCTPLSRPFPVVVEAGSTVRQTVTLTLSGDVPAESSVPQDVVLTPGARRGGRIPSIGVGAASHGEPLTVRETKLIRMLGPKHLRVDLDLSSGALAAELKRAAGRSEALGTPLEAALFVGDRAEEELGRFVAMLEAERPAVARWLVFHGDEPATTEPLLTAARRTLARYDADVPVGAGTNAYFVELNRNRPPAGAADAVCYSVCPQVHAFDDASMVETVQAYESMIRTARNFAGGAAVAVTPVTLKARLNPDSPDDAPPADGLPPQVDPRQAAPFGAVWTLGSIKHLAEAGADSVTYFETTGWSGVVEREDGPPNPALFPSSPGHAFPLFHVLADALELADGTVVPTASSDRFAVEAFVIARGRDLHVLLANYSRSPRRTRIAFSNPPSSVRVRRLAAEHVEDAGARPEDYRDRWASRDPSGVLVLEPHEYVRMDAEGAAGGGL